ncbi:MAG: hypothetical protein P4L85_18100 [Paludisphaera borealis]|uniref:hypothetical protein n=1 Tax=Paludisphaera borealis TaxID=1387353 RepID=UPI002842DD18|nr:hypothetical protein [Paludisphaera borealis]MDR3621270.1 hypothetical protein [Paludisphaera borealis]
MSTPLSDSHGDPPAPSAWRRWNKWFWLWFAASLVLVCLIYAFVPPMYEAESWIRVDPTRPRLFSGTTVKDDSASHFIATQMTTIMGNIVIKPAISDSSVVSSPVIRNSIDPLRTVRERLTVSNKENTDIVRVAFWSEDPREAAAIVNAVVASYLRQSRDFNEGRAGNEIRSFEVYLEYVKRSLREKEEALAAIGAKGIPSGDKPRGEGADSTTSFAAVSDEFHAKAAERLLQAEVELIEAESQSDAVGVRTERIATLKKVRSALREMLASREPKPSAGDQARAAFLTRELEMEFRIYEDVLRQLQSHKFANSNDGHRIQLIDAAEVPGAPVGNARIMYMALAPAGLLVVPGSIALLGALARRRGRSARTADSE